MQNLPARSNIVLNGNRQIERSDRFRANFNQCPAPNTLGHNYRAVRACPRSAQYHAADPHMELAPYPEPPT